MTKTLQRARELAPAIRHRSEEIEAGRRLPLDLVDQLRDAGCFRMHVPAAYGGDELTLGESLDVIETLSRADGSTGWTTMIGCEGPILFGFLPKSTFDTIYASGPDVIGAGSLAPKGRAVPTDGGYCISGQWPFASGCQHADWLVAQAVTFTHDEPTSLPSGVPDMRVGVFRAQDVEVIDTWRAAGLQRTGSHDIRLMYAYCPEDRTFSLFGGTPTIEGAAFAIPPLAQLALHVAAVAIGIGQGALDDICELAAGGKRRVFAARRLAESAVFQDALGQADTTLRAARALLHADAEAAWAKASRGDSFAPLVRARLRATASHAASLATQVVDAAYTAGGGTVVYESSPLQRRLRDIHALTQHMSMGREVFALVGTLLAGEELDPRIPL
jgi:alkylation response protein AidB-like acyl-CoA dehydrogenase